jgi:hypothetical protein
MTPATKHKLRNVLLLSSTVLSTTAYAAENGASNYPSGAENFGMVGNPPPGFYALAYVNNYQSSTLKDSNGSSVLFPIPGFKINATAVVPRIVWITGLEALGGSVVAQVIMPIVTTKISAPVFTPGPPPGPPFTLKSQSKTGIGDVTIGAAIGYKHTPLLNGALGLSAVLPTGSYNQADLVNLGRNHTSLQPSYALTYQNPNGFNGDLKITYNINQKNSDTNYKSGDELFADYAAGYGTGNGWVFGVGGHLRKQLNDDTKNGATVANSKVSSFSIGPSVRYQHSSGLFVTVKFQKETAVRNTTQGTALWVKASLPF